MRVKNFVERLMSYEEDKLKMTVTKTLRWAVDGHNPYKKNMISLDT